jgi:S1-C subfamily serine protease
LHVEMAEETTPDGAGPGSVRVLEVAAGTPARQATFQSGDVIVSIDQQSVQSLEEFLALVQGPDAASELNVLVDRNGERKSLLLIVDRSPSDTGPKPAQEATDTKPEDH